MTWLRHHRWWLLALPVALVAMLGASSYRAETFWWQQDYLKQVAHGGAGEFLAVDDPGFDLLGDFERHYRVRLTKVAATEVLPESAISAGRTIPDGAMAVAVHLDFEADPRTQLIGCRIVLVDSDGVAYGGAISDPLSQINLCTPGDTPGPMPASIGDSVRPPVAPGNERPEAWSVAPVILVAEGAEIVSVQIRFDSPEFVELSLQ